MSLPISRRTALIPFGPQHSDIPALAGALDLLGATAGGVGTSDHVTGVTDKVLAQAGLRDGDLQPLPEDWLGSPEAAGLLDEAVLALTRDHGEAPVFVMTDPRISRLLPFWRRALERVGAEPLVVQVPGTALDIALSGEDDATVHKLRARIEAVQADHRARIAGLQSDRASLIQDLRSTSERLAHATRAADDRQAEIGELSDRLAGVERRLHVADAQLRQLARQRPREMQERLHLAIALDDPDICSEPLSDLILRVDRATARLEAERAELQRHTDQLAGREARLVAERDAAHAWGRHREAELQASLSWRVTAPLRALSRGLRRLRGRT